MGSHCRRCCRRSAWTAPQSARRSSGRGGLAASASHVEQLGYSLPDAEQCWEIVWYTGARIPLTFLPPPVVERFKAEYLAAVAASATERGIWVDWPAVFSLARKPGQPARA